MPTMQSCENPWTPRVAGGTRGRCDFVRLRASSRPSAGARRIPTLRSPLAESADARRTLGRQTRPRHRAVWLSLRSTSRSLAERHHSLSRPLARVIFKLTCSDRDGPPAVAVSWILPQFGTIAVGLCAHTIPIKNTNKIIKHMILKSLYLKNILLKKIIAYSEIYSIIIKKKKLLFLRYCL